MLVSLGAEVGYKVKEQPELGLFPLLVAALNGHEKVVRALLKAGAKVDAASKSGRTPVGMAAWTGVTECLELLLEKKELPLSERLKVTVVC
jgi:ankyrin repeat protein